MSDSMRRQPEGAGSGRLAVGSGARLRAPGPFLAREAGGRPAVPEEAELLGPTCCLLLAVCCSLSRVCCLLSAVCSLPPLSKLVTSGSTTLMGCSSLKYFSACKICSVESGRRV